MTDTLKIPLIQRAPYMPSTVPGLPDVLEVSATDVIELVRAVYRMDAAYAQLWRAFAGVTNRTGDLRGFNRDLLSELPPIWRALL